VILADVPEWVLTLRDSAIAIGAVCGALLTIAAAAKLPVINKPIHWAWRGFVSDPMRNWLGTVIHEHLAVIHEHLAVDRERMTSIEAKLAVVEHEVRTNDGQSLRDVADRVEAMAEELISDVRDGTNNPAAQVPRPNAPTRGPGRW